MPGFNAGSSAIASAASHRFTKPRGDHLAETASRARTDPAEVVRRPCTGLMCSIISGKWKVSGFARSPDMSGVLLRMPRSTDHRCALFLVFDQIPGFDWTSGGGAVDGFNRSFLQSTLRR